MLLLTAAESARLDRATIDGGRATGDALMERAGRGVAEALVRHVGSPLAWRVLVLCGGGNNGGDGFVVASHLAAMGAQVHVGVTSPRERIAGDAQTMLGRAIAAGLTPRFLASDAELTALLSTGPWDLGIDALLGTGAQGEPRGVVASACAALRRMHEGGVRVVAVDVPSGVNADTGAASAQAVQADLTVTFGNAKRGHFLYPGRLLRGALEVADIGLLAPHEAGVRGVWLAQPRELGAALPRRDGRAHKGDAGRALIVGASQGMTGALVLAARAACRAGAGYVRAAAPASLHDALAAQLVEAMPVAAGEGVHRSLTTSAAPALLDEAQHADAVALGPGLSRHNETIAFVHAFAPQIPWPLVLDADALFAYSPPAGGLESLTAARKAPLIVTPHVGEMARLTGLAAEAIETRRIDAAAEWAQRWCCVVVLKGAPTVIADADGRVCVNPTGNPGMATAGMGDVLTGILVALLAQGMPAFEAACAGAFAHGLAGDLAARELGATGIVASDVVDRMPRALQLLRETR